MRFTDRPARREIIGLEAAESFRARAFTSRAFPFQWHYHPEIELTLIVKGRGTRLVGDSVEHYDAGDLVLLGADLPHTWSSDPDEGQVESVVVQFLPEALGILDTPEMRPVTHLLAIARQGLSIEGANADSPCQVMRKLVQAPPGSPARLARLMDILCELSEHASLRPLSAHVHTLPMDARDKLVRTLLERLNQSAPDFPSQANIAHELGFSTWSFSRFFQQQIGKPYSRYVNDWRVQHACRRLIESDDSITTVALDAGFRNLANFHRRFREVKTMTPKAYRCQAQQYQL